MRLSWPERIPRRVAAGFVAGVAALALAPWVLQLSPYSYNLVTLAFLLVSGALAWNWMGGFVGQVSFGHAAMFGVGGFVAARILEAAPAIPAPLAWLVGGLAAGLFALIAHPTLRLRGPYFSIATIGLGETARLCFTYWEGFTGGSSGLSLAIDPDMKVRLYWWGLGLMALVAAASFLIRRSALGLQLLAIKADVDAAAEDAELAAPPDPSTATLHIYSGFDPVAAEPRSVPEPGDLVTMVDAINHGLREEMERNPKIVMWGEDIADPKGGVFGVTRGLTEAFPDRVVNSPLAEASIVGVAQGMAIGGYKPVVEIQFSDYSFPAFMQIRNEISTLRWRSGGVWKCPVVVRMATGGYIRGGPFHSQSPETLYAHTPGWYVAYPSNAADAKGLIKTACRMDDPVIFFEHKGLYRQVFSKSPEPGPHHLVPFGKARVVREGTDVTVITWGSGVIRSVRAAADMEKEGHSVEVLDLRTIVPLDEEAVCASVRKTGRAMVVHEAPLTLGFGAEVAARIAEGCFADLDAPVRRVAALDCFPPYASALEAAVLPSQEDVARAIRELARW